MPRPPAQPDRSEIAPGEIDDYDFVVGRHQRSRRDRPRELSGPQDAGPYFGALLRSPPFAAALARLGSAARTAGEREGSYAHWEREWVDQVLCTDWRTNAVQVTHIPDAVAVGVRPEAIQALRAGREDELTEDERFLTRYVREVVSGTVTDESYERLEQRLGKRGAAEYTIFIGFLSTTIRLHQAFAHPEPSDEEVDRMLRELADGTRAAPDARTRFQ